MKLTDLKNEKWWTEHTKINVYDINKVIVEIGLLIESIKKYLNENKIPMEYEEEMKGIIWVLEHIIKGE